MTSSNSPLPIARPWTRGMWLALVTVVIVGLCLGWLGRPAEIGLGGDEATYISLAQSLKTGNYRDEFLASPVAHAQYPPGNPAWLLLVQLAAGGSLGAIQGANLLLLVLSALLLADALRRLGHPRLGIAAGAATMLNPGLLQLAGTALSEMPYLAWTSLALWATVLARNAGRAGSVFAIIAATGALFTRLIGVAVIGAVAVPALWTRSTRRSLAGIAVITIALAAVLWWVVAGSASSSGAGYANDVANLSTALSRLSHTLVSNVSGFARRTPVYQFGFPDIPGTSADTLLFAATLAAAALFGFVSLVRAWPAAGVFVAGSLALLLIWPWPDARLASPLAPWVIVAILFGAVKLAGVARARFAERYGIAAATLLIACAVQADAMNAIHQQACRASAPYVDARCYHIDLRGLAAAAYFVRDSVPASAVIATSEPATLFQLSHHRAMLLGPSFAIVDSERIAFVPPAAYLLLSRKNGEERGKVAAELNAGCRDLVVRAEFARGVLLLAPRKSGSDTGTNACAALGRFVRDTVPDLRLAPW